MDEQLPHRPVEVSAEASRRGWHLPRIPRVAVAVGVTAFAGLAGAGLAVAASGGSGTSPGAALSASSATTSTTLPAGAHPKVRGPGRFAGPAGLGGFGRLGGLGGDLGGRVVHGEYTVKNGTTYRTVAMQVGKVTAVSAKSITVKSADGFTQTYVVQTSTVVDSQSGGIAAVAGQDQVRVEALVQGATQTATDIVDTTKIGASRKGFGFGPAAPGEAPVPPSPPTSSGSAGG